MPKKKTIILTGSLFSSVFNFWSSHRCLIQLKRKSWKEFQNLGILQQVDYSSNHLPSGLLLLGDNSFFLLFKPDLIEFPITYMQPDARDNKDNVRACI